MPAHHNGFPSPWRNPMRITAVLGLLGLVLLLSAAFVSGPALGLMAPGIALSVFMGGAWAFSRSRAALIEPDLERLRRGEAVMGWDLEPRQWDAFVRGRRIRARAWLLGGSAGISLVPALLFAVLLAGPSAARPAAEAIGWALGGLWVCTLGALVVAGRTNKTPRPVVFAPKLCAVGNTVFAWPNGIAMIDLDEDAQTLWITRKGALFMPAMTFGIPVPTDSLEQARTLLPS
ncbi:MAG: hypothetical protein KUG77_20765 [Nannocystaceae bacterium]|nr:hypothetical protein [Nannocystaceae bacterium]